MAVTDIKARPTEGRDSKAPFVGFHKMIPNLMTIAAMAAGMTSIQFSMNAKWEEAVMAILIAAILDMLDGATARILKAQSDFGAQLDSLSDFLAFGVAPAILLYAWILEESGKVGWIAMIVYAAATALRLARYNLAQAKLPDWKKGFFAGVPSPAGAGLVLLPVVIWLQFPSFFREYAYASPLMGLWTLFIAGLMVSRIPAYSSKMIRLPAKMGIPALAFAVLIIAALVHATWITLTIVSVLYLISIPVSINHFRKLQKEHADDEDMADMAIGAIAFDDFTDKNERDDT